MSTKGLMEHKKVAEVTLNEAGKAATLTLKAPWLFDGQRGPFTLKNVDHGHKIVKGSYHEDKGPKSPAPAPDPSAPAIRSPFGARPSAPPAPVGPSFAVEAPEPLALPDRAFLVWQGLAQSDVRDVRFWFWTANRRPIHDIEKEARRELTRLLKGRDWGAAADYDIFIKEHSLDDEAKRPSPFHHLSADLGRVK